MNRVLVTLASITALISLGACKSPSQTTLYGNQLTGQQMPAVQPKYFAPHGHSHHKHNARTNVVTSNSTQADIMPTMVPASQPMMQPAVQLLPQPAVQLLPQPVIQPAPQPAQQQVIQQQPIIQPVFQQAPQVTHRIIIVPPAQHTVQNAAPQSAAAISQPMATAMTKTASAKANVVMRSGPDRSYDKVGYLPSGHSAQVLACQGDWCELSYDGQTGWSHTAHLVMNAARQVPTAMQAPVVRPAPKAMQPVNLVPKAQPLVQQSGVQYAPASVASRSLYGKGPSQQPVLHW